MNIAAFSTRDLREQGCKSYETSDQANKKIGGPTNVFLQTTSMKVMHRSFLPQTIPNIWYSTIRNMITNESNA